MLLSDMFAHMFKHITATHRMVELTEKPEKPTMFPVKRTVGFRKDQDSAICQARAISGRARSDIIRDGAVTLAKRIVADAKRKKDE